MTKSKRTPAKSQASKPTRKALTPHTKQQLLGRHSRIAAAHPDPASSRAAPVSATTRAARPPRPSKRKKSAITALLQRPQGAALAELTAATGWLEHSVRAALTGLRRDGQEIVRSKDAAGASRYRIVEGP